MRKLERFLRLIDNLNEWVGRITFPLVLLMTGVIIWEVVLRYFFNNPTIWAHETSVMILGAYFMMAGGYALLYKSHVNMDLFYNRLSLRGRAILDLISSPLFFIFCGVMLWKSVPFFLASLEVGEITMTYFGPPLWPVKLMIIIGASFILLQGSAKFIRDLIIAITGREAT